MYHMCSIVVHNDLFKPGPYANVFINKNITKQRNIKYKTKITKYSKDNCIY